MFRKTPPNPPTPPRPGGTKIWSPTKKPKLINEPGLTAVFGGASAIFQTGVFQSPTQVATSTALLLRIDGSPPVNATLIVTDSTDLRLAETLVPGKQYVFYGITLLGSEGVNAHDNGLRSYKIKPNRVLEFDILTNIFDPPSLPDAMDLSSFLAIPSGSMSDVVYGKVLTYLLFFCFYLGFRLPSLPQLRMDVRVKSKFVLETVSSLHSPTGPTLLVFPSSFLETSMLSLS